MLAATSPEASARLEIKLQRTGGVAELRLHFQRLFDAVKDHDSLRFESIRQEFGGDATGNPTLDPHAGGGLDDGQVEGQVAQGQEAVTLGLTMELGVELRDDAVIPFWDAKVAAVERHELGSHSRVCADGDGAFEGNERTLGAQ